MRILTAVFLLISALALHAGQPSQIEKLAQQYIQANETHDAQLLVKLIDPSILAEIKQTAIEAYKLAAEVMHKKKQASSWVYTSFPSQETLTAASPEEVFATLYEKTRPPKDHFTCSIPSPKSSYFHTFKHSGRKFIIIKFTYTKVQQEGFATIEVTGGDSPRLKSDHMCLNLLNIEIERLKQDAAK